MTGFEIVRKVLLDLTTEMLKELNKKALAPFVKTPDKLEPKKLDAIMKKCGYEGTVEEIAAVAYMNEFACIFTADKLYAVDKIFRKTYAHTENVPLPLRYDEVKAIRTFKDSMDAKFFKVAFGKSPASFGVGEVVYEDGSAIMTFLGEYCIFLTAAMAVIKRFLPEATEE